MIELVVTRQLHLNYESRRFTSGATISAVGEAFLVNIDGGFTVDSESGELKFDRAIENTLTKAIVRRCREVAAGLGEPSYVIKLAKRVASKVITSTGTHPGGKEAQVRCEMRLAE